MARKRKVGIEDILLSAFVGVESAHGFSAFEPSVFTIGSLVVPQGQQRLIRLGYIPAVTFSVALGGIVGAIRHSWLPIAFGLGTSAFMVFTYEMALRYSIAPIPTVKTKYMAIK